MIKTIKALLIMAELGIHFLIIRMLKFLPFSFFQSWADIAITRMIILEGRLRDIKNELRGMERVKLKDIQYQQLNKMTLVEMRQKILTYKNILPKEVYTQRGLHKELRKINIALSKIRK